VAQFEVPSFKGVIPTDPRFHQRAEGSPVAQSLVTGDPSLRLKNGCAQDDPVTRTTVTIGIQTDPLPGFIAVLVSCVWPLTLSQSCNLILMA